jgi:hypothetical protein
MMAEGADLEVEYWNTSVNRWQAWDDFAAMRGKGVGRCRWYISQAQDEANNCRARAAAERKKAASMRIEAGLYRLKPLKTELISESC